MGTPRSVARSAFLACLSGLAVGVAAAQPVISSDAQLGSQITQIASATTGVIAGQVLDERGQPLSDVVISAVGGSTSFAVSDGAGQFMLRSLTPGPYLVRAHLDGYVSARHTIVTVRPSARAVSTFMLRREGEGDVLAAGAAVAPTAGSSRDEGETAWRLRRLKRSILKEADPLSIPTDDDDWFITESLQMIGRAFESSARMAGALFTHAPLRGEVNLLTTGAFDTAADLLSHDHTRGVAFFSLGAPVGNHGDWTVRAALNQGDLSSWILAGNYATRTMARHRYQFGMSYGLHRYAGGNVAALAAMPEAARNVGAVYGHDEWNVSRFFSVGYGGHYAHYDYLLEPAHFSPRLTATLRPSARTHIRGVATRRVTAPGAEEFLPPTTSQILPPQRTFSPLTRAGFLPEDTRHYEVAVDRVLDGITFSVRAFQQGIDDQLVTVFGLRSEGSQAAEIGHYFVGSAGNVEVRGWGLSMIHSLSPHVRGSVDYSLANAEWASSSSLDRARLGRTVPSALRESSERIHDLTTSLETALPQSATRVYVLYKLNSAYVRDTQPGSRPGFDGRWDVQVIQALPFMNFTTADWEMLVGVRNLFREGFAETSVYDELLVVRPPKRLVGGITVKF